MTKQAEFTIRKRVYTATENEGHNAVKVSGEIFGGSGRLLPGLTLAIYENLIAAGYPVRGYYDKVGDYYSTIENDRGNPRKGVLTYFYHPTGWHKVFQRPFADNIRTSLQSIGLREKAENLDRRYHLAKALGLNISRRLFLNDPVKAIESEFAELVASRWTEHGHPYPNIVPDPPRLMLGQRQYGYTLNFTLQAGDSLWLTARLIELQGLIRSLAPGDQVSKFPKAEE